MHFLQRRPGPMVPAPTRGPKLGLLLGALLGANVGFAQTPPPVSPAGFHTSLVAVESQRTPFVRGFLRLGGNRCAIAIGPRLELFALGSTPRPVFDLRTDDLATIAAATTAGTVIACALRSGTIHWIDTNTGQVTHTCPGPANAFGATALPTGDVLLQANPTWPQSGSHSGVWLAGPGRQPREILALQGPSGPLLVDHHGDLIVAELGPIVPPPLGASRLLRIPAATLQLALTGATLTIADAVQTGTGFAGIYALAEDDLGCLHTTDPASSRVTHCAPGGLSPIGTTLDAGPGMFALGLQFTNGTSAPFVAYQPAERAPRLLVARTDFWSQFEVLQLQPERPQLTLVPAQVLAPGQANLTIAGAPPAGFAMLAMTLAMPTPEHLAATLLGTPLWLALPGNAPISVQLLPLDALGAAHALFTNPGGFAVTTSFQAVVLDALGSETVASTPLRSLQLLP
jgi:hypothetical protein